MRSIAFDGSPESRITLRAARGLATPTDATLPALRVDRASRRDPRPVRPAARLEPLVTIERAEELQHQEQATRVALDSALHELGDGAGIE